MEFYEKERKVQSKKRAEETRGDTQGRGNVMEMGTTRSFKSGIQ